MNLDLQLDVPSLIPDRSNLLQRSVNYTLLGNTSTLSSRSRSNITCYTTQTLIVQNSTLTFQNELNGSCDYETEFDYLQLIFKIQDGSDYILLSFNTSINTFDFE